VALAQPIAPVMRAMQHGERLRALVLNDAP